VPAHSNPVFRRSNRCSMCQQRCEAEVQGQLCDHYRARAVATASYVDSHLGKFIGMTR